MNKGFCEGRPLVVKRPRIAARFAFKFALLLLATSVFGWGLQAKLSLYKTPESPSTVIVAKLLTERRSAQAMETLEKAIQRNMAWNIILLLFAFQAILIPSFRFHQVEVGLCKSCRWDLQSYLIQRPPPTFR
jgi:hypothetical protein